MFKRRWHLTGAQSRQVCQRRRLGITALPPPERDETERSEMERKKTLKQVRGPDKPGRRKVSRSTRSSPTMVVRIHGKRYVIRRPLRPAVRGTVSRFDVARVVRLVSERAAERVASRSVDSAERR